MAGQEMYLSPAIMRADRALRAGDGAKPVMIAAGAGHLAILQILLEKDPDVNARDSSAHTASIWGIPRG